MASGTGTVSQSPNVLRKEDKPVEDATKTEQVELAARQLCELRGIPQKHWTSVKDEIIQALHIRSCLITQNLMGLYDV